MKDQKRNLEIEGLRIQLGRQIELDNPPELKVLVAFALRYTSDEPGEPERWTTKGALERLDRGEDVGDSYLGASPHIEDYELETYLKPALDAYKRLTGRTPGDDIYLVRGRGFQRIILPRSTLRALVLEARKYWEDWNADPPPPPPPPPEPEPEPEPELVAGPYQPQRIDEVYFAEEEPIAEAFERAEAAGHPIVGYQRAMKLGELSQFALEPRHQGLGDYFRQWGYPALGRFHDAATALDDYYRSEERRAALQTDEVPPIVGGPVSVDVFRLPLDVPEGLTVYSYLARIEGELRRIRPRSREMSGTEMMKWDDISWVTVHWLRETGKDPVVFRVVRGRQ